MLIDTFSGWTEAFPTKHDTTFIVTKKLLEDILPRYGLPQMIESDNGPALVPCFQAVQCFAYGAQ